MIVEIPVFFAKGKTPMRVELQIRTNGMDFWATLEPVSYTHLDVYKRQSLQSMITIGVNMTDTVMVGKLGEADPLSDFTICLLYTSHLSDWPEDGSTDGR